MPGVKMLEVNRVDLPRTVGIEWQSEAIDPIVPARLERLTSSAPAARGGNS